MRRTLSVHFVKGRTGRPYEGSLNAHGYLGFAESAPRNHLLKDCKLLEGKVEAVELSKSLWEYVETDGTYAEFKDSNYQHQRQGVIQLAIKHESYQPVVLRAFPPPCLAPSI